MPSIRIPVTPIMGTADRRSLLKMAAALGIAAPAAGFGADDIRAQEHDHATPVPGGIPQGGTGDATPIPGEIAPFKRYDPILPPAQAGPHDIVVEAKDQTLYVAKDVAYAAWTFDGTVPGRVFRVTEGDTVNFTLKNSAQMAHSMDFHSAKTPPNVNYKTINPGEEFSWSYTATTPGAYMYHCGTPPVLMHIGAGMYSGMIVDPKEGWSPAQELVFVQSEYYLIDGGNGIKLPDFKKMMTLNFMDYTVFNGHATQYVDEPIDVKVGEPIRIFVVNAGPNVWSSFHVVGAIFDKAYINANPKNELHGLQSITIGPGDGACVEFTVEEPGHYVAVNHAFGHATHGAVAVLNAT
ncbi:MAG TPA: multicopper oxidase domain-containing protein [Thermomicrobiales bacterium]|nr:multicopper oxidase domain-containing protein [Thermomicrobiales bacterium]